MASNLEFTGERYVPGVAGEIAYEHWHRYAFARAFVAGRRVLDVSCGEGYGSALLAEAAAEVVGIDIAGEAIEHARSTYAGRANLRFERGSATALPLSDASIDAAVSFETIEHLPRDEQPRMVRELARVLTRDGVLLLSAPNPVEYSQARGYRNPFHLHEPSREELAALLGSEFTATRWYRQRRFFGSALFCEDDKAQGFDVWSEAGGRIERARRPEPMYFVVVAARDGSALPAPDTALSLFADRSESELRKIDERAAEVLRLDALLGERDAALERQAAHVRHLEELAQFRESIVVERDAQLASLNAAHESTMRERDAVAVRERDQTKAELASAKQAAGALHTEVDRLERAIGAQERIIAYRQSARWWFTLPWLRVRLWLRSLSDK
jgi:ubiquinone/menaquinone biosynthesis C-methylase UbiE